MFASPKPFHSAQIIAGLRDVGEEEEEDSGHEVGRHSGGFPDRRGICRVVRVNFDFLSFFNLGPFAPKDHCRTGMGNWTPPKDKSQLGEPPKNAARRPELVRGN